MGQDLAPCPRCGQNHGATDCPGAGGGSKRDREHERLGQVLAGKYRLDGFISSGGMGSVYRATHLMLHKPVAIKVIQPGMVPSAELAQRFQREARAASQLSHPNIVAVHDLGQEPDGSLYIAMEFVDGVSLKQVLSQGPIESDRAARILGQLAGALRLAHSRGVIHRDLKPQNVMLCVDAAGQESAKLLDFGIAKSLESEELTALTSTGTVLGTPHYMSPEQAAGRPVDARSDLYSLGVILYEMLVGAAPFHDTSVATILYKHVWEPPVPPSRQRPDLRISEPLERIVMRCLEKDPAQRYASAAELLAELEGGARGAAAAADATVIKTRPIEKLTQPTVVVQASTAPEVEPSAGPRRRLPLVLAVAALLLLLLAAAAITLRSTAIGESGFSALFKADDSGAAAETEPRGASPAMAKMGDAEFAPEPTGAAAERAASSEAGANLTGERPLAEATVPPAMPESQPSVAGSDTVAATPSVARGGSSPLVNAEPEASDWRSERPRPAAPSSAPEPVAEPVPEPIPERPSVLVRCSGAPEVCGAFRTALEQQLARAGLPRAVAPARAEILLDMAANLVEERSEEQFGTTFVVRTYAIELWGEAPRFEEVVNLPAVAPLSFDSRFGSERLSERARVVAGAITDQIERYWAGRLAAGPPAR